MGIYSAVDCCEVHGSKTETMGQDSFTASVRLMCDWTNRQALMADIIGNLWPDLALWSKPPVCVSAGSVPMPTDYNEDGQAIAYDKAIITANYSTDEDTDLITESLEPVVEFITLDHKRFRWSSPSGDPLLEGEAPGRQMRSMNLVRTMKKLTAIPTEVLTLAGYVNDAAYASTILPGLNFVKESLLYASPAMSHTITTAGDEGWDLTMKYAYLPQTWNKYFRAKTGQYEEMYEVSDSSPYKSYPLGDFTPLLF